MKKTRQFAGIAAAVLISAPVVIAQDSRASKPGAAARVDEKKVMVVGCLRSTETTEVGTTISVVAYTLTNASLVNPSSTAANPNAGAAAATGTSGNASASAAGTAASEKGMTFALAAENLEELRTHENQRVEIVGRMSPSSSASPAGTAGPAGSTPRDAADAPRIRVEAVNTVAGTCDAK